MSSRFSSYDVPDTLDMTAIICHDFSNYGYDTVFETCFEHLLNGSPSPPSGSSVKIRPPDSRGLRQPARYFNPSNTPGIFKKDIKFTEYKYAYR